MITMDLMQDASEIVHYNHPQIPLFVSHRILSSYPDMKALCHWHEDIELIHIMDGEMNYDVNGHKICLQQGDSLFVNSKQMHACNSHLKRECSFICILFHPSLLMNHAHTGSQYVKPIIDNPNIEYLHYPDCSQLGNLPQKLLKLKESGHPSVDLEIMSILFQFWNIIYLTCKETKLLTMEKQQPTDLLLQKKMVSHIHQRYQEAISLEDIALSGNVSRSKCCILFKKYLQQSPIEFLNSYRLEVSAHLLKNTEETISSIAFSCGFNHLSYFSKLFFQKYHCTPSTFRQNHRYQALH